MTPLPPDAINALSVVSFTDIVVGPSTRTFDHPAWATYQKMYEPIRAARWPCVLACCEDAEGDEYL
jgi:hypothetical protein